MRILLTNDDGIEAPGLQALYRRLTTLGDVIVVAPHTCRSGTSHSITYMDPLSVETKSVDGLFTGYAVHGSPADCVKLACHKLLDMPVDLVVSGINEGANVGINVFYSGTVAAAIEAAFLNIPAVALSVAHHENINFDEVAQVAVEAMQKLFPVVSREVLNINVPVMENAPPRGIRVMPQSTHGFDEYYLQKAPHQDLARYQLNAGKHKDDPVLTDAMVLAQGYITVTPLRADMTDHQQLASLEDRLKQSSNNHPSKRRP